MLNVRIGVSIINHPFNSYLPITTRSAKMGGLIHQLSLAVCFWYAECMKKLLMVDLDDTLCASEPAYRIAERACYTYFKKIKPGISLNKFDQTYWKARAAVHRRLGSTASSHNRFLYFQGMFELLGLPIRPKHLNELTNIFWDTTYRHLHLFPTVKETLRILQKAKIKVVL